MSLVIVLPDKSGPVTAILKVLYSLFKKIHEVLRGEFEVLSITENKTKQKEKTKQNKNK